MVSWMVCHHQPRPPLRPGFVPSAAASPLWIAVGCPWCESDISAEGSFTFPAGVDFGSLRRVRLRSEIDVAALNLGALIDDRLALIDLWLDVDDTDGAEIDVIVEARVTDDDPAGTPVWSAWSRLDATEDELRAVELRARLTSASPDYNLLLTRLRIHAEEVP